MKIVKSILVGSILVSAIAQPAIAEKLIQADIDFAFDASAGYTVSDLIQLSPKEMDTIEGRYWVFHWRRIANAINGFYTSILYGRKFFIGRFGYKIKYDREGHPFGSRWGPLAGNRPHWQVSRWAIKSGGVKNSKGEPKGIAGSTKYLRIPWGRVVPKGGPPKKSKSHALSAASAADAEPQPSEALIALLLKEMPDSSAESADSGEPIKLKASAPEASESYTGPMPSDALRGYIFLHVKPTHKEVCTWVGGINC